MGASNLATMDSSSARVELETGRSWLLPNDGGSLGSGECWWETAGRGLGYNLILCVDDGGFTDVDDEDDDEEDEGDDEEECIGGGGCEVDEDGGVVSVA